MSLTLISYPVTIESGIVKNTFPGFAEVELEFKREDIALVGLVSGLDNQIEITVAADIVSDVNVGESIYLNAIGATYEYDDSFEVLSISYGAPNTTILLKSQFIEIATTGYVNYKQNYFVESKLVDPDNNNVLAYPSLLSEDGTPEGIVKLNVSQVVDFLESSIFTTSQEITDGRAELKVMYREVWREDDTEVFILVGATPTVDNDTVRIVIVHAADASEVETFVNDFEIPIMWEGYTFAMNLLHSAQNNVGKRVAITFDQLDINKNDINVDNPLTDFSPGDFGFLQANMDDNVNAIEDNTRFLNFKAVESDLADYETGDYNDTDYFTVNT